MPDPNEDVEVQETPSAPEQEAPVNQDPAVEAVEQPAAQEPEQTTTTSQPEDSVDERGVPWKNRAMELERKFNEVPEIIQRTVSEALTKQQTPKQEQYTIEQLEKFAMDKPEYRPWVESEKAKIIQSNVLGTLQTQREADKTEARNTQIRQQSEQWVVSHPEFKECFVSDAFGNRQWNFTHPLTQVMGQILNTIDPITGKMIKDRPDGLAVAAEMAYGRYALSSKTKVVSQVAQVKKDLRKAQRQTMVTGGSRQAPSAPSVSPVKKSVDSYNKTYNKQDIVAATKQHLLMSGIIKEE